MHENSRARVSAQTPNVDQHALVTQLHRSLSSAVVALVKALTLPIEPGRAAATALRVQELVGELGAGLDLWSGLPGAPSRVMTLPAGQILPGDRLIADLAVSEVFTGHPPVRHVSTVRGHTTIHHADGSLMLGTYEPVLIERGAAGDPEPADPAGSPGPEPADACDAPDAEPAAEPVHSEHVRALIAEADLPDADTAPDPLPRPSTGDWFEPAREPVAVAR